jgi:hypothetical protein
MKIVARFLILFSFTVVCSLWIPLARGDDGQEGGDDINGSESLETEIAMTATAAAPAGSSAELSLEAENENGASQAKLKLETNGLPADTYSVSVTLKSDGTTVSLGSFSLNGGDAEIEFGQEDEDDDMPFPPTFNPLDIATVAISNSANATLFTADLTMVTAVSSMIRNATVEVSAAPSSPSATGTAVLAAHVVKGQTKGTLQLIAHGLPSNVSMMIATNGVTAKKVNTNKTGNLNVTLGAKGKTGIVAPGVNMFGVTSLTVRDKFGNLFLSGNF